MSGAENFLWAFELVEGLVAAGCRRAVISPGSRSTPLALACERHPALRTWVQVDERTAAFFALGLARADLAPVAVVATSGTAPAHWYPAVIEANHGRIPLLLLSADRPPELQDCGANQTVDQVRLFGSHVRAFHQAGPADAPGVCRQARALGLQAGAAARWPLAGPVHINIPFREPLVPDPETAATPAEPPAYRVPPAPGPDPEQVARVAATLAGQRGVVVCGWDHYPEGFATAAAGLARALGWPLLADPLSGLRGESAALSRYDAFLRRPAFTAGHAPEWVIRLGAPPVSKALHEHLEAAQAPGVTVAAHNRRLDPSGRTVEWLQACPRATCAALAQAVTTPSPGDWLLAWQAEEARAEALLAADDADAVAFEGAVVRELAAALPAGATLFCGNSLPIRDLDTYLTGRAAPLRVVANRGASGIDGNLATTLGLAAATEGPTVALLGDLAVSHDLGGLLAAGAADVTFVVINNGGGGIFELLPQAGLPEFERTWRTPTGLDLERTAALFGLGFARVARQADFRPALDTALARPGVDLIEVVVDPRTSLERRRRYWARVAADED